MFHTPYQLKTGFSPIAPSGVFCSSVCIDSTRDRQVEPSVALQHCHLKGSSYGLGQTVKCPQRCTALEKYSSLAEVFLEVQHEGISLIAKRTLHPKQLHLNSIILLLRYTMHFGHLQLKCQIKIETFRFAISGNES